MRPASPMPSLPRRTLLSAGAALLAAREMQRQTMIDVPCIPLGEYRRQQAYRADLSGFPAGAAYFWGVRRG